MHNSTFLTILIMKKIAGLICLLMVSVAFSGMDDKVLRFSTPGPDRYADGSRVLDGECYALVWSPKGSAFAGFNADGMAVSANDRVVLAAPLAQDGKCRDAIFQVPADEYSELAGGECPSRPCRNRRAVFCCWWAADCCCCAAGGRM